ncbi:MAG: molybdopterin cofactor-binding domain-containing protein [Propylenella sp.]
MPDLATLRPISRRGFLVSAAAAGGAFAFGFPLAPPAQGEAAAPGDVEVYNWVVLAPDNTLIIRIAQMEMGQGTMTAMAQLLAEELEADWSTIRAEFISIAAHLRKDKVYGRTRTASSLGVKLSERLLRTAGAQIRTMLVAAAGERLAVPVSELIGKDSAVLHAASGRKLSYGELAADAQRIAVPDPATLRLKEPKDWKLIGKSVARLDVPMKVDGSAVFGIDVALPGMKHAAIATCPFFGGRLASHDAEAVRARPGVRSMVHLAEEQAVAIVADDSWQARTALDAMPIEWNRGEDAALNSIAILEELRSALDTEPESILRDDGDVDAALAAAARAVEAEYYVPYLEHATMEPMNCTALVTDDRFEVWAPTQVPETAIAIAAEAAGMDVSRGELHPTLMGGGFGRRQNSDFVRQAVLIAKAMKGTPIQLLLSREDTTRRGPFRPASLSRLRATLDANGNVTAWRHRIAAHSVSPVQSTYGADSLLYAVPNMRVDVAVREPVVPEAPMRGVAFSMNCFVTQSFVDELAAATGVDSYAFQRALLDPDKMQDYVPPSVFPDFDELPPAVRASRLRAVLDEAAAKSDWDAPLGPSRGRGIAINEEGTSYFAAVVEVTLDGKGWFSVDRVVVGGDPGFLVNPDIAAAQVEGSVAFGLTSAMYGEITIRDGAVEQSNFHDYPILRLNEMPPVEVHWVLNREIWGGVGEPASAVVIPALTNAIYDAGGPRIRALPLKNYRIVKREAR